MDKLFLLQKPLSMDEVFSILRLLSSFCSSDMNFATLLSVKVGIVLCSADKGLCSQVQNVHNFLLSDEKDEDKRIERERLEGGKKLLIHERVENKEEKHKSHKFPRGKEPRFERFIVKGPRREEMI